MALDVPAVSTVAPAPAVKAACAIVPWVPAGKSVPGQAAVTTRVLLPVRIARLVAVHAWVAHIAAAVVAAVASADPAAAVEAAPIVAAEAVEVPAADAGNCN